MYQRDGGNPSIRYSPTTTDGISGPSVNNENMQAAGPSITTSLLMKQSMPTRNVQFFRIQGW